VRHLANRGETSWAAFARMICARLDQDPAMVRARPAAAMGWTAARPLCSALDSAYAVVMTSLEAAVERYVAALRRSETPARSFQA
jgi:dTDP-4-dehydrorhamnose reductase